MAVSEYSVFLNKVATTFPSNQILGLSSEQSQLGENYMLIKDCDSLRTEQSVTS